MKLIMENWRKYVNEDDWSHHEPASGAGELEVYQDYEREFDVNYNLFYDYVQNELVDTEHPDLVEFAQNYHKYNTFPGWFKGSGEEWLKRSGIPYKGWDETNEAIPAWRSLQGEVKKRMDKEWKWDFPHDVDPEMPCFNKIFYLDKLMHRFFKPDSSAEMSDTDEWRYKQDNALTVTESDGGISPYRRCRSDLRSKKASEKEMEPYE